MFRSVKWVTVVRAVVLGLWAVCFGWPAAGAELAAPAQSFDVVIVGGTPAGIMGAIAAARCGRTAVILERSEHLGGLPANGLGATDIHTRGATQGLFMDFIRRVRAYYVEQYGEDSPQVRDCADGYRFEPHVAEQIFEEMLAEHRAQITVRRGRQFDALPERVVLRQGRLEEIVVILRASQSTEVYRGRVFIDATYEGDLAAAAGVAFRLGREGFGEFQEPMAGKVYVAWGSQQLAEGSTQEADGRIQAYNYRLCLTRDADNMLPIPRPQHYRREEYLSLIDDIRLDRRTGPHRGEMDYEGIGRVVNMVRLPNGKVDANNQHLAFLSTDLPEENQPWPTADWQWRDRFAERLRDYTLGLLWFAQHDPALPEAFRQRCRQWGLARDEYRDNGHFPRQVYVRESRRIAGEYLFTAHDALPARGSLRPPVHADSVTSSHYNLDSHAVRKREPGRVHLDGFFSYPTRPYTVPYGVIVPKAVDGLLVPVAVSGTHVGFSTLRMEPCWMALGEAAGAAAALSIRQGVPPRKVSIWALQRELLARGAMLIYFEDARPGDPHYEALQLLSLRGALEHEDWRARLGEPASAELAAKWAERLKVAIPAGFAAGKTTRGELLEGLLAAVEKRGPEQP